VGDPIKTVSDELVPIDPFHGYLDDMSDLALARLPAFFEFTVLERWFSDQTYLSFRQQAEDLMEFCEKVRAAGFEVSIWASEGEMHEMHRHFRFKRVKTNSQTPRLPRESSGIIDI
jgi:hypothetical protein